MRFLRRDSSDADRFGAFWTWWSGARASITASIESGGFDQRTVADISRAVSAVDKGLAWELAKGKTANHAFCVSPEGDPVMRQVAIRWLASAPPADATWEFHASKQPRQGDAILEVAGVRIDLGEMRAIGAWDESRRRFDVRLWHPAFADVPANVRGQVMFLFLDGLLGEEDVERWIGAIEPLEAPSGGRTPDELRAEIDRRRAETAGDERWILATGTSASGDPVVVVADASLKRIDHPFADHHVAVRVELTEADRDTTVLNAEEDDLTARLAGVAINAGHTTQAGWRAIHYVAEDPDAARHIVDAWVADHPARRVRVAVERDMRWGFQHDLGL
jgi:hypothetical protein